MYPHEDFMEWQEELALQMRSAEAEYCQAGRCIARHIPNGMFCAKHQAQSDLYEQLRGEA